MAVMEENLNARTYGKPSCIQYRYVVTALTTFGLINVQIMRICINVAIVSMVKYRPTYQESWLNNSCPVETGRNETSAKKHSEQGDFDWDENTQALILGAYFYGSIVSNLVGGIISEWIGAKTTLGFGVMIASIMTILSPLASRTSYIALTVVRILIGLSQGALVPCTNCVVSRWIPKHERTFLHGVMRGGSNVGAIVASQVTGVLCASTFLNGWPSVFYIFGASGLIWCLFWYFLMYEYPRDHVYISPKEMNYILNHMLEEGHFQKNDRHIPWKEILTSCTVWSCSLMLFGNGWGMNTFITDLSTYLGNILHYDISANGFLSSLHFVLGVIILVVSGRVADWIYEKRYLTDTAIRKVYVGIGSIITPILLIVVTFSNCNHTLIVALLTIAGAFFALTTPGIEIAMINMSPTHAATISGICFTFNELSGFLSAYVVGTLTENNETLQQWNIVYYIAAALIFFTSLPFLFCGSAKLQPWSVQRAVIIDELPQPVDPQPTVPNFVEVIGE